MIHSADPQSRQVVLSVRPTLHLAKQIHVFIKVLLTSRLREIFIQIFIICISATKYCKPKQFLSENNVHYWRDRGSGRVDHWWLLSWSSFVFFQHNFVIFRIFSRPFPTQFYFYFCFFSHSRVCACAAKTVHFLKFWITLTGVIMGQFHFLSACLSFVAARGLY